MLDKLEIHFGEDTLYVPQVSMLRSVKLSGKKDTLKECFVEEYKSRTALVKREAGEKVTSYRKITEKEAEEQLIKDLREYGSDFVFEEVWRSAYLELYGDGQIMFYDAVGFDEDEYEGVVENDIQEELDLDEK